MRYVSIFRRLSNAAIGQKGRFRMDTIYLLLLPNIKFTSVALIHPAALRGVR
jgi:hypothetical protein